ncbi:hypothetical protein [Pontivivens ytuae]|uniref:Asparagine synthetase domain-containing protein n=1 Tax=Pontivivens ytuae TaxID=2789856 RepID=A0A7S9LVU7_9RHOB|nr:hypothetical protein [Pontivivens ytuae]QPH55930.1 hypothetical protein I0K15_09470 [Pontivivens ytuae]
MLATDFAETNKVRVTDCFRYQYAISDGPLNLPGFAQKSFAGRAITHCPDLGVAELMDTQGRPVALCIGTAIDAKGEVVRPGHIMAGVDQPDWHAIERFVSGLAGRYVVLARNGIGLRLFGDVTMSMPCVYDPVDGIVASSLLMCLRRPIEESDIQDYRRAIAGEERFCFGNTRDRHVRSLPCNHWLELGTWQQGRFWPRAGDLEELPETEVEDAIEQIGDRLGTTFGALVRHAPSAVPLTGGNDSRVLVACGKPHLQHVKEFYTHVQNRVGRMDSESAEYVAKTLGLTHNKHMKSDLAPLRPRAIRRRESWAHAATGYTVPAIGELTSGLLSLPPEGAQILRGNVIELMRASNWKRGDRSSKHDPVFGLRRCLFVGGTNFTDTFVDRWLDSYVCWRDGLPEDAQSNPFDLSFVEHHLPNFGRLCLSFTDNFYLSPFNDRLLVGLAARLPISFRHANTANRRLIRLKAPEIADVPYARELMAK